MFKNLERLRLRGVDSARPGLGRIAAVLEKLGSPHGKRDYVAVAGTNGKGSVSACLESIFRANGYRTGLFTSPHLVRVTERIRADGREIAAEELEELLGAVFSASAAAGAELSYFELLTAAAFLCFDQRSADIGVLEVGMGGRWDSTNVCDHAAGVITNVSFDHTEYLGDTLREIAGEKAGIIKKNGLVATGCAGEPLSVIERRCAENSSVCHRLGKEFGYRTKEDMSFDYEGPEWSLSGLRIPLAGAHQAENAAISVAAAELLAMRTRFATDPGKVKKALSEVRLEGRMEYSRTEPPVVIDGAHNPAAGKSLVDSLELRHPGTKFNFLVAMLDKKDIGGFTEELSRISGRLVATELPGVGRCVSAERIPSLVRGRFDSVETVKDPLEAYERLLGYGEPGCVCGSFYLVGYLKGNEKNLDSE